MNFESSQLRYGKSGASDAFHVKLKVYLIHKILSTLNYE